MLNRSCNSFVLPRICKSLTFKRSLTMLSVRHQFRHRFTPYLYSRQFLSTSNQSQTDSKSDPASNLPVDKAKVNKLVEQVFCLNIIEMNQLMNRLQAQVGLSDEELEQRMYPGGNTGSAAASADGAAEAEVKKEKDVFTIKLGAVDAKAKIKIIKEVRTITGLGLKEAKDLVEKAPTVLKEGLKKEEAEAMKKALEEAGAKVELE